MNKKTERVLAFGFGIVFVIALLVLALAVPTPTPFQYTIFRVVLALVAAGVAAMIPGFLQVTIPDWLRAGGALAVFVIVYFYNPAALVTPPNGDITLKIVRELRDEFGRARDNLQKTGVPDFARAELKLESLRDLHPDSGHVWYFAGEIKRIANPSRFTLKSCVKVPLHGNSVSLDIYQQDFHRYIEIAKSVASQTDNDMGSEICYDRPKGVCAQRTAWVHHLLANDFYEQAIVSTVPQERATRLTRAADHAKEARKYRRPEGGEGFDQCTDTIALQDKIGEAMKTSRVQP